MEIFSSTLVQNYSMKGKIAPLLAQFHDSLEVVRLAADEARKDRRALSPIIAASKTGPYESTKWIDNTAKNLGPHGPVRVEKRSETENVLEIQFPDFVLDCAMYFAGMPVGSNYRVHRKGVQARTRECQNLPLPFLETEALWGNDHFWYALRIWNENTSSIELHIVCGANVVFCDVLSDMVVAYEVYIVKEDGPGHLVEEYVPSFTPKPRA